MQNNKNQNQPEKTVMPKPTNKHTNTLREPTTQTQHASKQENDNKQTNN